jgi:thiamine biosynthesis lipoprotein ApbE
VTDASVAVTATNSVEPVRWLAGMTALDYLVATSTPFIRRLVTDGSTTLHTLDDKTDPTCRHVLDTLCEHQADL